jgi:cell division protein ZapA
MTNTTNTIVSVEIAGQRYPIRSSLDVAYVTELAAYVDEKMKAAANAAPTSDMLGLALLVALNLADESFRARQQSSSSSGELNERALRLEQLVDDVLGSFETAHTDSLAR